MLMAVSSPYLWWQHFSWHSISTCRDLLPDSLISGISGREEKYHGRDRYHSDAIRELKSYVDLQQYDRLSGINPEFIQPQRHHPALVVGDTAPYVHHRYASPDVAWRISRNMFCRYAGTYRSLLCSTVNDNILRFRQLPRESSAVPLADSERAVA